MERTLSKYQNKNPNKIISYTKVMKVLNIESTLYLSLEMNTPETSCQRSAVSQMWSYYTQFMLSGSK
jgi:hypothetical protein